MERIEGVKRGERADLKSGRYYKILQRVQAIPAGIYRYEGMRGGAPEFSVGIRRAIRFRIPTIDRTLVVPVPYVSGRTQRVSEARFFAEVYENLGSEIEAEELAQGHRGNSVL